MNNAFASAPAVSSPPATEAAPAPSATEGAAPTATVPPPAHRESGRDSSHKRGFLLEFIRRPAEIGSIIPSSRFLAQRMVRLGRVSSAGVVVEYGPGTGPITGHVRRALKPGNKFFAVEINPRFAALVRAAHPGVSVHEGSAADIERMCAAEGIRTPEAGGGIDTVISGIPWASLPERVQTGILTATIRMLKPGGRLVTFGYSMGLLTPAGKRFHKSLPRYFRSVERSSLEWRNLPPAFVVTCIK
ncbi:MAG: class I SAM-dependent methyltransferase [Phycisphaerales bacterium]